MDNSSSYEVQSCKKLDVKDLINVGIFSALYIVIYFITACLGYIPIFMVLIPIICPIVAGIPFMLYISKIKKFGMITISGVIVSLLMFIMGHPWTVIASGVTCSLVADVLLKISNFKSRKISAVSYGIFSMWSLGAFISLFFGFKKTSLESYRSGYGDTYVDTLYKITPDWLFWIVVVGAFIGGLIGAALGIAVLKKHFKKAGIL